MAHRFRFLGRLLGPRQWELLDEEWHHVLKVLHLPLGSELEIADGQGHVACARLTALGKQSGEFAILSEETWAMPPAASQVTLAIAALKPQSADDLLPYLIELGMDGIEIFGSQSLEKSRMQEKIRERWDRISIAAMKQCKRPWAPRISWSEGLQELCAKAEAFPNRLYLSPEGHQNIFHWRPPYPGPTLAVIGSEKGLDLGEVRALQEQGFVGCRIEGSILRATTAAIATAALLRQIIPENLEASS